MSANQIESTIEIVRRLISQLDDLRHSLNRWVDALDSLSQELTDQIAELEGLPELNAEGEETRP